MADPNSQRSEGTQNTKAEGEPAPSAPPSDDVLKVERSKGYAHGYKESRAELLRELGLESLDDVKARLGDLAKREEAEEARRLAEQQEREALATELTESRRQLTKLATVTGQLDSLRDKVRLGRIRDAARAAGCRDDAVDLVVVDVQQRIGWDEKFSEVFVLGDDGKPTETPIADLLKEHRDQRPFLYQSNARGGSGVTPRGQGATHARHTPGSSLADRLSWGQ